MQNDFILFENEMKHNKRPKQLLTNYQSKLHFKSTPAQQPTKDDNNSSVLFRMTSIKYSAASCSHRKVSLEMPNTELNWNVRSKKVNTIKSKIAN